MLNQVESQQVARIILECLAKGKPVEIEGFGTFHPRADGSFRFVALNTPRVFISYASEDSLAAEQIYDACTAAGFNPWLDRRSLKTGQNWPRIIEAAIEASDFFIACLSSHSVLKRGGFQSEVRYALDIARRLPLDDTFIMPVRLDDCRVPARIAREFQYIDLFPTLDPGLHRLTSSISAHWQARRVSS
jgi:hypothetical protein